MANHLRASQSAREKSTIHLCGIKRKYIYTNNQYLRGMFHLLYLMNVYGTCASLYPSYKYLNLSRCHRKYCTWRQRSKYNFKKSLKSSVLPIKLKPYEELKILTFEAHSRHKSVQQIHDLVDAKFSQLWCNILESK